MSIQDWSAIESTESRSRTPVGSLQVFAVATPAVQAFNVEAPLVECAENTFMSTPASFMTFFSQCPIVAALTGL